MKHVHKGEQRLHGPPVCWLFRFRLLLFPAVSSPCCPDLSTLHGRDGLGEQQQGGRQSLERELELDDLKGPFQSKPFYDMYISSLPVFSWDMVFTSSAGDSHLYLLSGASARRFLPPAYCINAFQCQHQFCLLRLQEVCKSHLE